MDGNQLVDNLIRNLSGFKNLTVKPLLHISSRKKVFMLNEEIKGIIYVKAIAHAPHHWGITKTTVNNIIRQNTAWCVILLYDSEQTGYVISSKEYYNRTNKELWPWAQGDFKISKGKSLHGIPQFKTTRELKGIIAKLL
jgi:hypothetical protein